MTGDFSDMLEDDVQKFQQLRERDDGLDLPAAIELGFGSLTALVGVIWLISLYWVPDVLEGQTWMMLGSIGLTVFGVPAGLIYVLRRGGAAVIVEIVRGLTG